MNENSFKAPTTNRGAVNTINNHFLLIDWCQFTIFYKELTQDIYEQTKIFNINTFVINIFSKLFGLSSNDLVHETTSLNGYEMSYSYNNIYAYFSPSRIDMGINFKLSGQGCRDYERLGIEWVDLFKKLREYEVNYNRIDIAIDDYTGKYFNIEKLQKYIRRGQVVSKFKSSLDIVKRDLEDGKIIGNTLQFGSKASRVQITFYDKLKERISQNNIIDENIKSWIRTEIRFRHERAKEIATEIIYNTDFNRLVKGVLHNYISFVEKSKKDINKSRWKVANWWSDYLDGINKIQLSIINVEHSITKKIRWLDSSVSRTQFMSLLSTIDNVDLDLVSTELIKNILIHGSRKITPKDIQMINNFRSKERLSLLTKEQINDFISDIQDVIVLKNSLPIEL